MEELSFHNSAEGAGDKVGGDSLTPPLWGWGTKVGAGLLLLLFLCSFSFVPKDDKTKQAGQQDERVYLDHADNLRFDQWGPQAGAQVAKGNVKFLHKGAVLTCDSAYFYQQTDIFKAFGNVRMRQGDTLSLDADYAWYDGGIGREVLYASKNVVLIHTNKKDRQKTVLNTDSLVYDRLYDFAYYLNNGKITDKESELTSEWGEYHLDTRLATFVYNVNLKGKDYTVRTDTLMYDANTSKAHSLGPTVVVTENTTIETNDGYFDNNTKWAHVLGHSTIISDKSVITTYDGEFNTETEEAKLHSRSKVVNEERIIEADTLLSNDQTGHNEGFGHVKYTDLKNKNELHSGYFIYNKLTGNGYATSRPCDGDRLPLLIDYSQRDTLYLHADTMRIETFYIDTDSVYRKVHGFPHARMFRKDVQAVSDSLVGNSRDSVLIMYRDPIVWYGEQQLMGDEIHVFMRDSTVDRAHVINKAFSIEKIRKTAEELQNPKAKDRFNQISSREMWSYFDNGKMRMSEAISNVLCNYFPQDEADSTLMGMVYCETDTMRMFMKQGKLDYIWTCRNQGTMYPMTQIPGGKDKLPGFAWHDYIRPLHKDDLFEWRPKKKSNP